MSPRSAHIAHLRAAELQFRLGISVRMAVTFGTQPLAVPEAWSYGRHVVTDDETALTSDEADFAVWNLQRSTTFLMASAAKEAIGKNVTDPRNHTDPTLVAAWEISLAIRNAFSHNPFNPIWRIEERFRDRTFVVPDVITLNCSGLDGTPFDWTHYGGPLAILRLCQYVRKTILGDGAETRTEV